MASVRIEQLAKSYPESTALRNVDLDAGEREFLVILGPSGCGKSTLLRSVAGLEVPERGEVYIGDRCVFSANAGISLPPRERDIGMVFQHFALYPHMTVFDNIAFGLRIRGVDKREIARRVSEALEIVELVGFEQRRPKTLSGGQMQRVAVARTIAANPSVLLFDEPLSNLDPELRVSLRAHLKHVHARIGATSLYVTHDQIEAMVLADRIAVMRDGLIEQVAVPDEVYHFPRTLSVAEFTANPKTNLIRGEVHRAPDRVLLCPERDPYCFINLPPECARWAGQTVVVHVRPEDLLLARSAPEEEGRLSVLAVMPEGPDVLVFLRFGEQTGQFLSKGPPSATDWIRRGDAIAVRPRRGNVFGVDTHRLLGSFGSGAGQDRPPKLSGAVTLFEAGPPPAGSTASGA